MKGFLTWHDRPFRRTHNLDELGEQCVSAGGTLSGTVRQVAGLTGYAWLFRYPGVAVTPTVAEAEEEALESARVAVKAIGSRLPEEAGG